MEGLAKSLQLSIQAESSHSLQPHVMCSLNLCWGQRQWRAKLIDRRAVNMYYSDWFNEEAGWPKAQQDKVRQESQTGNAGRNERRRQLDTECKQDL